LVRNLAIVGRRKLPNREEYVEVRPEVIELNEVLGALRLRDRVQLIDIAILLGTDLNPEGVEGIGPQRALRLIQEVGSIEKVPIRNYSMDEILRIRNYFLNPPYNEDYSIEFRDVDEAGLRRFLVDEHDFGEERVNGAVERLKKAMKRRGEPTLDSFFG
jgi:flap endonuclease-1